MRDSPPRVFLSYKWEGDERTRWVEQLATDLRTAGIAVSLDLWDLRLGDTLVEFMTSSIHEADCVLFLVTPASVAAAEATHGGHVKFEYQLSLARNIERSGFRLIALLLEGDSVPNGLQKDRYLDMRDPADYDRAVSQLIDELLYTLPRRPAVGNGDFHRVASTVREAIESAMTPAELSHALLRQLRLLTDVEYIQVIFQCHDEQVHSRFIVVADCIPEGQFRYRTVDLSGIIGKALSATRTQYVLDTSQAPDYIDAEHSTVSELVVPMVGRTGLPVGAFNLESPVPKRFDGVDIQPLADLAQGGANLLEERGWHHLDVSDHVHLWTPAKGGGDWGLSPGESPR